MQLSSSFALIEIHYMLRYSLRTTGRTGPKLETKILHKYLPPVKVELTVELGGTAEARILIVVIRCLIDDQALMVVDQKGKIVHATKELGGLLGYKPRDMISMDATSLMPSPISHLHTGWMKVSIAGLACGSLFHLTVVCWWSRAIPLGPCCT